MTSPDPEIANLRRVLKGWSDWYRFATRDDDPFIHGYLAALKATPPEGDET